MKTKILTTVALLLMVMVAATSCVGIDYDQLKKRIEATPCIQNCGSYG